MFCVQLSHRKINYSNRGPPTTMVGSVAIGYFMKDNWPKRLNNRELLSYEQQ